MAQSTSPPDAVIGRRVFFATENVDVSEDTPHGKGTLHGTAMAIYQRKNPEDTASILRLPFIKNMLLLQFCKMRTGFVSFD